MEKWIDFFCPHFPSRDKAEAFVRDVEGIGVGDPLHIKMIMMHQTQRLVSIADDLPKVRKDREPLQLLFLLICAENIAKLHNNFNDDGFSRKFVREFFEQFVVGDDRRALETSFRDRGLDLLNLRAVADCLYDIRCDVVHEGQYWGFQFHDGSTPMLNCDPNVQVFITLKALRDIIVMGCIAAISACRGHEKE
jgi:hypothetical protein